MDSLRTKLTAIILLPVLLAGNAAAVTLSGELTGSSFTLTWTEYEGSGFDRCDIYVNDGQGWALEWTIYDSFITQYEVTGLEQWETYSFKVTTVVYNSTSTSYESEDSNIVTATLEGDDYPCLLFTVLIIIVVIVIVVLTMMRLKKIVQQEKEDHSEEEEEP